MNAVYKKFNYKPNAASKKQDHKPKDNSIENMVWMRLVEENNNKKPETQSRGYTTKKRRPPSSVSESSLGDISFLSEISTKHRKTVFNSTGYDKEFHSNILDTEADIKQSKIYDVGFKQEKANVSKLSDIVEKGTKDKYKIEHGGQKGNKKLNFKTNL